MHVYVLHVHYILYPLHPSILPLSLFPLFSSLSSSPSPSPSLPHLSSLLFPLSLFSPIFFLLSLPDEVGGATTNMSTSSEVTSGGKVFVVKKQPSMDSCDGSVIKTPPTIHVPVIRKSVAKKNGDIRASLTEEIFANEINAQHSGELCHTFIV